jgi:hypothetical protein
MSISRNFLVMSSAVISILAMSGATQALEFTGAAYRGPTVGQQRLIDGQIQSLQNEQMRRDYQMQQQFYREQDRPRVAPQQMEVPIYRPNCQNSGC